MKIVINNIEFNIQEERDAVRVSITSPQKPVVLEITGTTETPIEAKTPKATVTAPNSDELAAVKREYERFKKAAYRAKKRLEANLKALRTNPAPAGAVCPTSSTAGCPSSVPAGVPRVPEVCPPVVPNAVPGDNWGQGQNTSTYYNICNTNTTDSIKTVSDKTLSEQSMTNLLTENGQRNCLPFVTEGRNSLIPLAKLPEELQKVLTAWNNLPLPEKLKGLFTDKAKKLCTLLKQFGTEALYKAFRYIAESPFLQGKGYPSQRWHICFGWLLDPQNMKKVLTGRYQKRERYQAQGNYVTAFPEYKPWVEEEIYCNGINNAAAKVEYAAADPAAAEDMAWETDNEKAAARYLNPVEMTAGVTTLSDQTRRCLNQVAALLGINKNRAA